jgi:hypothetical protein
MSNNIIDLDILRPEAKKIVLCNKTIDVSFIPCAITFEVDEIVRELVTMTEKNGTIKEENIKKGFDLTIKLCATFVSCEFPEMDYTWFLKNTHAGQINALADAIKMALTNSYKGVEDYGKN